MLIALLLRIASASAAAAEAEFNPFTVAEWNVVAGTTFTITWKPTTEGTVSIDLVSVIDDGGDDAGSLISRSLYGMLYMVHPHFQMQVIATKANPDDQ